MRTNSNQNENEIYFNEIIMKEKIDGLENNPNLPNKKYVYENESLKIECSK
jgi:hypothetical protein